MRHVPQIESFDSGTKGGCLYKHNGIADRESRGAFTSAEKGPLQFHPTRSLLRLDVRNGTNSLLISRESPVLGANF